MSDNAAKLKRTKERLLRRRKHIRKTVSGSAERPRLVVYRSNIHIYAQIVDDENRRTIVGCSSLTPAVKQVLTEKTESTKRMAQAKAVGNHIAVLAKAKGVTKVCFDRNGRSFHGRVKTLAEAARQGGLEF